MTQWGLDTLFNPAKRHMDEEKRRLQSTREEIGDSSGGKRIDFESGKVTIRRQSSADAADAAGVEDEAVAAVDGAAAAGVEDGAVAAVDGAVAAAGVEDEAVAAAGVEDEAVAAAGVEDEAVAAVDGAAAAGVEDEAVAVDGAATEPQADEPVPPRGGQSLE